MNYSAEMLDQTVFGYNTRLKQGGLKVATMSGKGFFDNTGGLYGIEGFLFTDMGVDDVVISLFGNGLTEGDTTNEGYAMKGVLSNMTFGGAVGTLLTVDFAAETRGIV